MFQLDALPLTISGILKNGWRLYKSSLLYVLWPSFIISLLHIIPNMYGYVGVYQINRHGNMIFSGSGLLIYALLLIVEAFFLSIWLNTLHAIATKQKLDYKIMIPAATRQLIPIYLGLIIYFLVVNLGIILLIVPGIFAAILFSMFLPLIAIDNKTLYASFENSARLVWGYWWRTFFVLILPYLIAFSLRDLARFTDWGGRWVLLADLLIVALLMPYFYAALLLQYYNLKEIKALPQPTTSRPRTSESA